MGGIGTILLEEHTASSSATLDFTSWYNAAYDDYVIKFINLIPATNAVNLEMLMSTNGGSSYDTGSNYAYANWRWIFNSQAASGSTSDTKMLVDGSGPDTLSNTVANGGVCGSLELFGPANTSSDKLIRGQNSYVTSGGAFEGATIMAIYKSTSAVNACRFLFSSGNIASGIIRVYGLTH